jgi:hypothetical protein
MAGAQHGVRWTWIRPCATSPYFARRNIKHARLQLHAERSVMLVHSRPQSNRPAAVIQYSREQIGKGRATALVMSLAISRLPSLQPPYIAYRRPLTRTCRMQNSLQETIQSVIQRRFVEMAMLVSALEKAKKSCFQGCVRRRDTDNPRHGRPPTWG